MNALRYRFHEFELDCVRHELRRAGRPVKIENIPFDLLVLLAESGGDLVARETIVERLWGAGVFQDTEQGINTAIRKLRLALRDDPQEPRCLQTVVGHGYRFIAPVTKEPEAILDPPVRDEPALVVEDAPARRRVLSRRYLAAALLVFLIAAGGVWWLWTARRPAIAGRAMLAVLPFANLTGDPR